MSVDKTFTGVCAILKRRIGSCTMMNRRAFLPIFVGSPSRIVVIFPAIYCSLTVMLVLNVAATSMIFPKGVPVYGINTCAAPWPKYGCPK